MNIVPTYCEAEFPELIWFVAVNSEVLFEVGKKFLDRSNYITLYQDIANGSLIRMKRTNETN